MLDSEDMSFRFDAGISMPPSSVTIDDKERIVLSLAKHYLIYSCKGELDQLNDGVSHLSVLDLAHQHCVSMRSLFLASGKPKLTATTLLDLFKVFWSPQGSNRRGYEEAVVYAWTQYVYSCEGMYSHNNITCKSENNYAKLHNIM